MNLKYIILLFSCILGGYHLLGQEVCENPSPVSEDSLMQSLGNIPFFNIYKDNYLVVGSSFKGGKLTKYNSNAKFQISLRHRIYRGLLPYRVYMYITYTQKSFWDVFQKSSPFAETNYNPSLGFGRNFIHNGRLTGIGMLQIEHESNGRDGIVSRSWNFISLTGIYIPNPNFSVQAKAWVVLNHSYYNPGITRYSGIGLLGATFVNNRKRLVCSALMTKRGGWNLNANWQLSVSYKLFKLENQYFTLQYYSGYGESMIHYNEFSRYLRFGFVIRPNSVSIF